MNSEEGFKNTLFNVLQNLLQEGPEGDRYRKRAFELAKTQLSVLSSGFPETEPDSPVKESPSPEKETRSGPTETIAESSERAKIPKRPKKKTHAPSPLTLKKILEAETIRYILDKPLGLQEDDDA